MYGIPDPLPISPSLKEIKLATGNVSISFRVLIVAMDVQPVGKYRNTNNNNIYLFYHFVYTEQNDAKSIICFPRRKVGLHNDSEMFQFITLLYIVQYSTIYISRLFHSKRLFRTHVLDNVNCIFDSTLYLIQSQTYLRDQCIVLFMRYH